ncbi:hypothetical protein [Streptomyces sp. NPDC058872]|uniref:hypothetical protein n=1 Tax=Streptomyces sp. NPDC058872 TaxID=3346661 RepID=UPI0036C17523
MLFCSPAERASCADITHARQDRWGTQHYGRLSGILAAPAMTASALASFAAALLAGPLGGYPELFGALAAIGSAAALVATATSVRGAR